MLWDPSLLVIFVFLVHLHVFYGVLGSISTLTVPAQSTVVDSTICRTVPGLTRAQLDLCFENVDATNAALQGLQLAVLECQNQFQGHRWNCSTLANKSRNPHASALFQRGYKETAFAYAISSAGVAMSVARACSQGKLISCGCDPNSYQRNNEKRASPASRWKWGGCSHNLKYGIAFSKKFLDSREQADDIHSKINLHNNQAGRLAVENNMIKRCKCHGMSGSCELKTCWRSAPDFQQVGRVLKERFESAVLVDQNNLGNGNSMNLNRIRGARRKRPKGRNRGKLWTPRKSKHKKRDLAFHLLYYQKSPNFCNKIPQMDVQGTTGRECNMTSFGADSCSSLCCGRGYNLLRRRRVERCNCKFHWCCYVECQNCTREEYITVCK